MPRMSSTSCITGTGFMKWMPMNRSGRSVEAASRVIEIDEVFVATIVSGRRAGQSRSKIRRLVASSSVAASITRSAGFRSAIVRAGRMRPSAPCRSASDTAPFDTWRARLPLTVASPPVTRSSLTACNSTAMPASAQTWAMPLPI